MGKLVDAFLRCLDFHKTLAREFIQFNYCITQKPVFTVFFVPKVFHKSQVPQDNTSGSQVAYLYFIFVAHFIFGVFLSWFCFESEDIFMSTPPAQAEHVMLVL